LESALTCAAAPGAQTACFNSMDAPSVGRLGLAVQLGGTSTVAASSAARVGAGRVDVALKRAFDVVMSAFALSVLAVPLAIIALLIKATSPGPVLYRQRRVGRQGRPFTILKFRSMYRHAERWTGPAWAQPDDPRATAVGRHLRRAHLDELPQLWNVLRGDMSIVGPRPERPYFVARFRDHIPRYVMRHRALPGLTGWAQVHGWSGNTPIEPRIAHDLEYIENWSLALDRGEGLARRRRCRSKVRPGLAPHSSSRCITKLTSSDRPKRSRVALPVIQRCPSAATRNASPETGDVVSSSNTTDPRRTA
jgi:lipopolysaccharide/colanic/teichoic acid biosynthesis glycosyltransferase